MYKDVLISIKGKQEYVDAEADDIELLTPGRLSRDSAGYALTYHESPLTGIDDTITTIYVNGAQITVMREGKVNSQMVFESGRRQLSLYDTPYGAMAVGVSTRRAAADMDEESGSIEIDYAIDVDQSRHGRNVFQISFQERKRSSDFPTAFPPLHVPIIDTGLYLQ